MALINLSEFKLFCNILTSDKDDLYQLYIDAACDMAQKYTHREFERKERVGERYDGSRSNVLILKNYPIISISKIIDSGEEVNPKTVNQHGYLCDFTNGLVYNDNLWSCGRNTISVDYISGFEVIPSDLKYAVLAIASYLRNLKNKQGIRSQSLGVYSASIINEAPQGEALIPDIATRIILDKYKDRSRKGFY